MYTYDTCMYTDVHTYHTYVSGVLSFSFASYKSSQGWLWFKKNMTEKNWIEMDEKICHDYIRRDNGKILHWSKTRGTPQHNPSTHNSLSCANKRTTTAARSRKKRYQSVVPLLYVGVSYCRCCRCIYVGYEWYVTGRCLNTLYTRQCQEM